MENLLFNLQMFAEDDELPTEEVENPSDDDEEDEGELELDLEDDSDDESSEEKPETDKETKRKNFNAAQQRLSKKQAKQEAEEKVKREAYVEGIKKSLGGKNRFTGATINDEIDVEEFEIMLEMEEKGMNPVEEYNEYVKQKRREERQKQQELQQQEQSKQKKIEDDVNDFIKKYGKEKTTEVINNQDFMNWAEGLLDSIPLSVAYEKYSAFEKTVDKKAEQLALEKDARRNSSSGGLGNTNEPARKKFSEMTDEEFADFLNSVR